MERSNLFQQLGAFRCQEEKNLAPIQNARLPLDEAAAFQSVDQADRAVMFHLEPLAQIADREAGVAENAFKARSASYCAGVSCASLARACLLKLRNFRIA